MKIDWDRVDDANRYSDHGEHDLDAPPPRLGEYHPESPQLDDRVPPPPKGKGAGGADITVSTEALKVFASNLRELREVLIEARSKLQTVDIKPGAFYDAGVLITRTEGSAEGKTGLVPMTVDYLDKTIAALEVIAGDIEELVREYDTAEEVNGLTAVELGERMGDAVRYIGKVTGLGANSLLPQDFSFELDDETADGTGGDDKTGDDKTGDDEDDPA